MADSCRDFYRGDQHNIWSDTNVKTTWTHNTYRVQVIPWVEYPIRLSSMCCYKPKLDPRNATVLPRNRASVYLPITM